MPAPAVIPAPKAYINAVAVKGFVVELRVAQDWQAVLRGPSACNSRTFETSNTGAIPSDSRVQRTQEGARDLYCD